MRNLILSTFTFFGLVLSLTCSSHAGVVLVDTRHSVSTGEPTIDNTGTLIAAFNFGNADFTTQEGHWIINDFRSGRWPWRNHLQ